MTKKTRKKIKEEKYIREIMRMKKKTKEKQSVIYTINYTLQ